MKLTKLPDYSDELGNWIDSPTVFDRNVAVTIRGKNNRLSVDPAARIKQLSVVFDCDNGTLRIGPNGRHGFAMSIRIGQDASVIIGAEVTSTTRCIVSAVEGATVQFGDDVMIASESQFRADDGHPIFDVSTGKGVNPVKDVRIGNHVWFGAQAIALAGAGVKDGTMIGFRSVVTREIPNNCIAVGSRAKVVRKNIAWERPHLSFVSPPYKPNVNYLTKSDDYWNETLVDEPPVPEDLPGLVARILRRFGYAKMRRAAAGTSSSARTRSWID